ncbi:MAG: hypothetical protein E7256_12850 [Lachnospiraceae bacterium]|nr:hypothetical protein [Lachnospiraceae bacterium]
MAQGGKNGKHDGYVEEPDEYRTGKEMTIYVRNGDSVDALVITEKPYEEDETSIYEYDYECLCKRNRRMR